MKSLGKKMLSLMLSMLMLLSSVGTLGVLAAREYEGELSIFKNIVDFENIVYSEYNTVYVPMEEVCGYLNIGVSKLEEGKFTLTRITDTLSFSVDNTVININGRDVTLPAAPSMRNGVVYIPAELFSMGFAMPMTKSADNRSADIEPNVYKIFIDEQNAAAISAATPTWTRLLHLRRQMILSIIMRRASPKIKRRFSINLTLVRLITRT